MKITADLTGRIEKTALTNELWRRMSEKEIKEVDRFDVVSEDGRVFTLVVHQTIIISHSHDGNISHIPGLKRATTTEGYSVNHKGDNTRPLAKVKLS